MASMYDRVVTVTLKPPSERDPKMIEPLLPWFRKKSEVFSSLKDDVVVDIIRNCDFITPPRNTVIIRQGDIGDCFYIILRGTVSIYINNLISDEEDESKIAEHTRGAQFFTEKGELDRSKFGNHIVQFHDGKSFGELALINKNCIRNASIITDEVSDLIVVNRELYNRSLRAAQAAEFEERNNFVKRHPFFRNWAPKHKKQLAMSVEKVKVPFEGLVCRQGEPASKVFFMLKGQAKILIDGALHPSQFPQFYPLEDPDLIMRREELEQGSVQHLPPRQKSYVQPERPSAVAPYAQRKRERARKPTEMSIIGPNEIIGDSEFVLDLKSYLQTVECSELCEVYSLNTKNYERLITKRNPKTVELLRHNAEVKLQGRTRRFAEDHVPLLKTILFRLERLDRPPNSRRRARDGHHSPFPSSHDVVPQRGALIDMFGPGTVFYRAKMREQAKRKQKSKQNFRGARGGFHIPVTPLATAKYRNNDREDEEDVTNKPSDDEEDDEAEILTDRSVLPYGVMFSDYKSSDKALSILETRIKQWHSTVTTAKQRRAYPTTTVKLERVHLDKSKELVPGRTVILRKKRQHGMSLDAYSHVIDSSAYQEGASGHVSRTATTLSLNASSGPAKTIFHSGRIQGIEEEAPIPGAFEEFASDLLTPKTFLRLFLKRASPAASEYNDTDRQAPPEAKGTILDVLKNRESVEGKAVSGIQGHKKSRVVSQKDKLPLLSSSFSQPQRSSTKVNNDVTLPSLSVSSIAV